MRLKKDIIGVYVLNKNVIISLCLSSRVYHVFKDMDQLMITADHPYFNLPVVTYICQHDNDTINDVKRRLIKELVNRVKEPLTEPDFQETAQMDRDETNVSNESLTFNLNNYNDQLLGNCSRGSLIASII